MISIATGEYNYIIGKNQNHNQELLNNVKPNDYWIHVANLPSAHVFIDNPDNVKIPNGYLKQRCVELKEKSKYKSMRNVEFHVTQRKFLTLTNVPGQVKILKLIKNIRI